ncbi:hypothetical protein TUBRATIS_21120 [Tubulinosema ratisbonensis]|uniref:Uncharacterized protein n=1 Tax=Tubulinosema ratisbonensis TaxID=291195 RepID=A0A437AJY9_9MICR|nr:hypothetical protein TUBRATIS_21120 [Tubulinosema ratisbonensis]
MVKVPIKQNIFIPKHEYNRYLNNVIKLIVFIDSCFFISINLLINGSKTFYIKLKFIFTVCILLLIFIFLYRYKNNKHVNFIKTVLLIQNIILYAVVCCYSIYNIYLSIIDSYAILYSQIIHYIYFHIKDNFKLEIICCSFFILLILLFLFYETIIFLHQSRLFKSKQTHNLFEIFFSLSFALFLIIYSVFIYFIPFHLLVHYFLIHLGFYVIIDIFIPIISIKKYLNDREVKKELYIFYFTKIFCLILYFCSGLLEYFLNLLILTDVMYLEFMKMFFSK